VLYSRCQVSLSCLPQASGNQSSSMGVPESTRLDSSARESGSTCAPVWAFSACLAAVHIWEIRAPLVHRSLLVKPLETLRLHLADADLRVLVSRAV